VVLIIAVACLCGVALVATLVKLACVHRPDLWITSETAVLCVVSPAMIILLTFGGVAISYRLAHGGLAAVPVEGWIGSVILAAVAFALHRTTARRLRRSPPGTGVSA
jgi:hypothetical protein